MSVWQKHSPLFVLIVLVTYFWWPALWGGQVIIHADAAHHGLSLLSFHAQALHGGRELLWDSGIYGGHPLFAEGQGGFANPLNILIAFLFEPEYGIGVFHWLSMLLSGIGVYCLALTLGIRPWAAVFASLATVYSGSWIGFQYNLSVSGALTWLPWLLASVEFWLNRPTLWRACLMSIAAALLIFAGYPHIAHGAAIYLVIRLSALLFTKESRAQVWDNRKRLIQLGILAVVLAVGLSAIQLLPLAELIGQSHRSEGSSLPFAGLIGLDAYIRGMLFFNSDPAAVSKFFKMESLASSLVLLLFGAVFFSKPSLRIVGHLLAAIFLFNLGMEFASPIFKLVYELHLIPGLHNYRIMHPFFPLAVIGMAVVSAYVLDNIFDILQGITSSWIVGICGAFYCLLWAALIIHFHDASLTILNIIEPLIFLVLCAGLFYSGKSRFIVASTVALYAAGAIAYKSDVFNFYGTTVLRQPESIRIIREDPQLADFKATTNGGGYVFIASNTPGLDKYYKQFLKQISPFPALNWGVPSIDGVLGLALSRRTLIQRNIEEEIEGSTATQPGSRIIDVLGIKYISRYASTNAAGLELIHHDADDGVLIFRNNHARPRFQLYERAAFVDSPSAALQQLVQSEPGLLVVEGSEATSSPQEPCQATAGKPARLKVSQATSMDYQITVSTECPVWLFVADANYPGWEATVNGQPRTVYSAQILGKAVRLDAGKNNVLIRYVPHAFYWGVGITAFSIFLVLGLLLVPLADYFCKPKKHGAGSVNEY